MEIRRSRGGAAEPPRKTALRGLRRKEKTAIGFPKPTVNSFPVRNGTQTGNMSITNRALNVMSRSKDEKYFVHIVCVVGESRRVLCYLLTKCLCSSKSASSEIIGALMPTQTDVIGFKN